VQVNLKKQDLKIHNEIFKNSAEASNIVAQCTTVVGGNGTEKKTLRVLG
jgi:hypothetical protein